jgi:hypothetical protein
MGKLWTRSVESATTQSFRLLQKRSTISKGHPSVSRKEPNKSNKWRNMSRKQLIGPVPYSVGEFMNNRNQKNGFACQVCRFEERGKRCQLSFALNTVCGCVRRAMNGKQFIKKTERKSTTVGWHQTMIWVAAASLHTTGLFKKASANEVNQDWNSSIVEFQCSRVEWLLHSKEKLSV